MRPTNKLERRLVAEKKGRKMDKFSPRHKTVQLTKDTIGDLIAVHLYAIGVVKRSEDVKVILPSSIVSDPVPLQLIITKERGEVKEISG